MRRDWHTERLNAQAMTRHPSDRALQEYVAGSHSRDMDAHVADCAQCSAEADALVRLYRSLAALPAYAPSPAFADQVMASVALPTLDVRLIRLLERWVPERPAGWAAAAAFSVVPAFMTVLLLVGLTSVLSGAAPAAMAALAAAALEVVMDVAVVFYPVVDWARSAPAELAALSAALALAMTASSVVLYHQLIRIPPSHTAHVY